MALRTTPLDGLHRRLGARMVPFAGYAMPVQYPDGIIAEHRHCRAHAALFDVSHMGQARLTGREAATALERLVPGDILGLKPGRQRYTLFTNEAGGVLDDLMVARLSEDSFLLVVNAARKADDFRHIAAALPGGVRLRIEEDRALLALQGPAAAAVLTRLGGGGAVSLAFMAVAELALGGTACLVSRSGYTGEDGFEISVPVGEALGLAERL
ncbi:MAG: glycine cleavage system protein T, partial [Acetobacteraceae bacterium]|nr:glycine cleavage system protein T [Acetobacteraceae bacterium]